MRSCRSFRQRRAAPVLWALAAALSISTAHAAGYSIYEQGAAVLGMAGAGTASVHDPSALFYNPAAMTRLAPGATLYLGGSALTPTTSFAGNNPYPGYGVTEEMKRQLFFPPTFYLTRRFGERFAIGVGANSPFGLGVEWKEPDTFTGRYVVTKAELTALNGNLSAAYAITPELSLAAGGDALFARVKLRNRELAFLPGGGGQSADVAEVALESSFKRGYGWNAALSYVPTARLLLGATYRSEIEVDVNDGDATFRQILTGNPLFDALVAQSLPPDQAVGTALHFPAIGSGGVAFKPTDAWTLEADFNYFGWSVFRELAIKFKDTPQASRTLVEDYDDSWQIRAGAEHRLEAFTYRFGYYYDRAAAPTTSVTPILPDANRHGVTFGLGWALGPEKRWAIDLYDLALLFEKRSTEGVNRDGFDGTYQSFGNATGLSLAYRW